MRKEAGRYDVVVVGAGHAGCEAAAAASAMGLNVCLITIHLETIAQMSCNPSVGGIAKGHLVREIDALGGLMGLLADETGIQFRLLNRSRGGAVQAPRAQCDKARYRLSMKNRLEALKNLTIFQGIVSEVVIKEGRASGVKTLDGATIPARTVVLAPGTFLNGTIHLGLRNYPAGRANEPPSVELGENLKDLHFRMMRLKTGTPMRLDGNTIDWSMFSSQPGDENPVPFSFRTTRPLENKVLCYIGYTNEQTHKIILRNLDQSPLFTGKIAGIGPRYCPSIEDKVVKFRHRTRHQFFLEPEGLETSEIYVSGISSSLPFTVQEEILSSIPGLDGAKIMRPAYGIEYDAVSPRELSESLETRKIENLYLAGQINGTSGYEEAAAQGLMAGINAGLKIKRQPPLVLKRDEAYIGVLVDDLVNKGVEEPYRLFTAMAEYRLQLRVDNADSRLMKYGHELGLIADEVWEGHLRRRARIQRAMTLLKREKIKAGNETISLLENLKRPDIHLENVLEYEKIRADLDEEDMRHIESEVKYEGYIKKQDKQISRISRTDKVKIPRGFEFRGIAGLTREAEEKLERIRPATLGEAKKIPGITPASISNISIHIQAMRKKNLRNSHVPRGTSNGNE